VHERPHAGRPLPVRAVIGPDEDDARAAAASLGARHRRADPVPARFIAGRGDDAAAVGVAADDDGLPAQAGITVELHGGEEGVEVEVRDHECNLARSGATFGTRP